MTKKPTYEDLEGRIRDLEKTESENRNLKERYERITDNADEAIFLVNPEGGHVLYQNNAAERIFGFSKEEWLSDPELALKIIHPDYKEKQIQVIKEINASKKPIKNVELAWVAKNGSKVIMEYTLIPILDEDGRIVNFESIGRDITLRKQTQQSRERLFNNSVDMLCIANTEGYFKELSPAFEKTLGWAGKELMSKPFIEFVHPEDREATFERLKEQAQGKSVHHFTNRYLCKDGSYKWISWNGYSLPEEQIIFSVGRDITEWKRAEEALQKSEERYRIMADSLPNLLVIHNGEEIGRAHV